MAGERIQVPQAICRARVTRKEWGDLDEDERAKWEAPTDLALHRVDGLCAEELARAIEATGPGASLTVTDRRPDVQQYSGFVSASCIISVTCADGSPWLIEAAPQPPLVDEDTDGVHVQGSIQRDHWSVNSAPDLDGRGRVRVTKWGPDGAVFAVVCWNPGDTPKWWQLARIVAHRYRQGRPPPRSLVAPTDGVD